MRLGKVQQEPAAAEPAVSKTNYVFLDGDEFLWTGTQALYPVIYAKAFLMMKRGIRTRGEHGIPGEGDPEFQAGRRFYFNRVGLTEVQSYIKMLEALSIPRQDASFSLPEWIRFFKGMFDREFRKYYQPRPGAEQLLQMLRLRNGYQVFILSNNTGFSAKRIADFLGFSNYCRRVIGAPFGAETPVEPFRKADHIARIAGRTSCDRRRVFVGGDSISDIDAAFEASERGVAAITFATTHTTTYEALCRAGANLVLPDLTCQDQLMALFDGKETPDLIGPRRRLSRRGIKQ